MGPGGSSQFEADRLCPADELIASVGELTDERHPKVFPNMCGNDRAHGARIDQGLGLIRANLV